MDKLKRFFKLYWQHLVLCVLIVGVGVWTVKSIDIRAVDVVQAEEGSRAEITVSSSVQLSGEPVVIESQSSSVESSVSEQSVGSSVEKPSSTSSVANKPVSTTKVPASSSSSLKVHKPGSGSLSQVNPVEKPISLQPTKPVAGEQGEYHKPQESGGESLFVEDEVSGNKVPYTEQQLADGKHPVKDTNGNTTGYVPDGKPLPNPDHEVNNKVKFYVTLSIDCKTILNNKSNLAPGLDKYVANGVILKDTKVVCYQGESVWDVLSRECKARGIQLESSWTPLYGSVYVEGINNLYEFDCGQLSGWCYQVDGWYPNYGCSSYVLKEGETIRWRYTCDLGRDIGLEWME